MTQQETGAAHQERHSDGVYDAGRFRNSLRQTQYVVQEYTKYHNLLYN